MVAGSFLAGHSLDSSHHRIPCRAEAASASGELRATVMDALAHEFKTPLTSMKAISPD